MAITISSTNYEASLKQSADLAVAKRSNSSIDSFGAANQRVEQQINSTSVKLSAYSQIKSGFAGVQAAAQNIADPAKTASSADLSKAVQQFASSYNAATSSISTATDSRKSGALSQDARARAAGNDLKSIVTGSSASDLKKIGISVNRDGTIAVDNKVLQNAIKADPNAVKDALTKVGKQAEQVSTRELAAKGNVGASISTLGSRTSELTNQLSDQKRLYAASQDAVQKQVANFSRNSTAVASYLQTLAM